MPRWNLSLRALGACTVVAPTRLHVALLDCSNASPRRYGGIGIALDEPCVRVQATIVDAPSHQIVGLSQDSDLAKSLAAAIGAALDGCPTVCVELLQIPPRHIGLGSGTAIRLASLMAATRAVGLDIATEQLAHLSGRGGVSGIGVNSFSKGGIMFDAGHAVQLGQPFMPSSYRAPDALPPVITRLTLPSRWHISLILLPGKAIAGESELTFFLQSLPLPKQESLETISWAYHGVAPAIALGDIEALSLALCHLHTIGMKRRELENQTDEIRETLARLQERHDIAAGMSSFGPLLYAIADVDNCTARGCISETAATADAQIIEAIPNDTGYRAEIVNAE